MIQNTFDQTCSHDGSHSVTNSQILNKKNLLKFIPSVILGFFTLVIVNQYIQFDTLHLSHLMDHIILASFPCCVILLFGAIKY